MDGEADRGRAQGVRERETVKDVERATGKLYLNTIQMLSIRSIFLLMKAFIKVVAKNILYEWS